MHPSPARLRWQQVTGHVGRVESFDAERDAGRLGLARSRAQPLDKGLLARTLLPQAGQHMHPRAADCSGVHKRLAKARLVVAAPIRKGGDAALAAGPVARRRVDKHLLHPVPLKLRSHRTRRCFAVREERLDGAEAVTGGEAEALEVGSLGEEHAEVRREAHIRSHERRVVSGYVVAADI